MMPSLHDVLFYNISKNTTKAISFSSGVFVAAVNITPDADLKCAPQECSIMFFCPQWQL